METGIPVIEAQIESVYSPRALRQTKLSINNPDIESMSYCTVGLLVQKKGEPNAILVPAHQVKWAAVVADGEAKPTAWTKKPKK